MCWVVPHHQDEVRDGVQVIAIPRARSRTARWLLSGWRAFRKALSTHADVYHFHDPELIPQGIVLRLLGKRVVYDIHEDYVSSISQKEYLPLLLRRLVSRFAGGLEQLGTVGFTKIIAERYYEERFPQATKVLNYPVLPTEAVARCRRSRSRLLYTGKVHLARGAAIHAAIPAAVPGTSVHFIGRCSSKLYEQLIGQNQEQVDQLHFRGVGGFVPFDEIRAAYAEDWLAGLAIFPPNEHLDRKELTKFFEYMMHGIPIIASNFSTWRALVEDHRCGICVDPNRPREIQEAIRTLQNDEQLWAEFSANGPICVQQHYSWASQEQKLLQLYHELTST